MVKKVALVTGASSGIGYEAALQLMNKGFKVYGAARRMDRLEKLERKGAHIVSLDVTQENSMVNCVETIINQDGRIDVLVNNAGYGSYGAIEDVPLEEARRQIEVNVFGLARMTQLVLPYMRQHKFGRIINISSMGGKIYTPFGGWYHATKFAVEALSDCMRLELNGSGIDVILVEPGGIKTDWGIIAANNLKKASKNGAYEAKAIKAAHNMERLYSSNNLTDTSVIGKAIAKAATAKKPKTRYLLGYGAKPSVFMRRVTSDRMYDKMISKMM